MLGLTSLLWITSCSERSDPKDRSGADESGGGQPTSGTGSGGTGADGGEGAAGQPDGGGVREPTLDTGEVFLGPGASWSNVKTRYGAVGDGVADDTAALQAAIDSLVPDGNDTILYIPAGSYRLTDTLRMYKKENFAILGEDPTTTRIVWDGPANTSEDFELNTGVMLLGQGASHLRIGRITFDGKGKANYGIRYRWGSYATSEFFPSGMEHFDLVFEDMGIGIGAGFFADGQPQDTAEYSHVFRSTFRRCEFGVATMDFNSLLWGVMDSRFEDNGVGVWVNLGNANVYDSVFRGSREADIRTGNIPFLSARGNYSSGSTHFLSSDNPITATLQNNTVIDPLGAAVIVNYAQSLTLVGNRFATGSVPPLVFNGRGALLSADNTLTAQALHAPADSPLAERSIDDRFGQQILVPEPALPSVPMRFEGPIVTVPGLTGEEIQAAIDEAAGQAATQTVVVYFPRGDYSTAQTLRVPEGLDLRLVGDGSASALTWSGEARGELLRLEGPSRATLQDLRLSGGYNGSSADTLVVAGADQPGGSVVLYALAITKENTNNVGVTIDGIDESNVEVILPYYFGGKEGALRVTGGTDASARADEPANVRVVDAFPRAAPADTYQVLAGGRVIALDQWNETDNRHYLRMSDAGQFTLSSASFGLGAPLPARDDPTIGAQGANIRLSVIGGIFGNSILGAYGQSPTQNMLVANTGFGGWGLADDGSEFVRDTTAGSAKMLLSASAQFDAASAPNDLDIDDAWLRSMLRPLLKDASTRLLAAPEGVTSVRVIRLNVGIADHGVRITQ